MPLTREVLMDTRLPEPLPTDHVQVRRIRIPAGQAVGRHTHNGPVFGNIVQGSVRFQVEGEPETVLHPGDVFYEPAHVPVPHFDAMDEDVTFLAYFPLTSGQEPEML